MERNLIWLAVGCLISIFLVPYFLKFRRDQKLMLQRKREAESLGIGRPRAQFPQINTALCIGCGSCVAACPEHDVLGVINGTATIINGERCVGHGHCELVCPVGALKVGLGDLSLRPDIPLMNRYNETSVPGLYIAGELGGLSLIRNAIAQGRMVIEDIVAKKRPHCDRKILDVIIVGAGPAGLSATMTAISHKLSYLVLDEQEIGGTILHYPRRKLVMTQPVEIPLYGWLEEEEYSKETLLGIWTEIINQFGLFVRTGEKVDRVEKSDGHFLVHTQDNIFESSYVVLALGRRGTPRKMEVTGEELPKVMYQLADAQSYRGLDLLVVGGGDSAVEAAIGLARQPGNKVTISYRKGAFFRVKRKNEIAVNDLIAEGKVTPLFDSQVREVKPRSVVLETKPGLIEIANDYVFVYIGGIPPFNLLKTMGIAFGGEATSSASKKEPILQAS
ncbi:MAG: NAD(P)-binding domain-containing protein [candidate division Zixibacteria bacterium]|nr:NAD(P)-binding domain-containing protein [candidate division Zixibacteria bacterium]